MGKKSLAEQIAELKAPKSDFDIEDSELADPFAGSDNDGENSSDSNDEVAQRGHYVSVSKSKLRRENGLIKDKKYTGQVTDRKALYGDGSSGSGDEESELSSENDAEESEDEDEEDEDEDEDDQEENKANDGSESESDQNSDQNSSEEEGSDNGSESEDEKPNLRQREQIKKMMESERKHIVNRLSQSATADALKGYAILQQHKEFDAIIDCRLKLQKALTNSNLLPANKHQLAEIVPEKKKAKEISQQIDSATEACYDLLDTIASLQNAFFERENLIAEGSELHQNPKKRTLTDYLARSARQDDVLSKYRTMVLTKWSAKIQNSSGSSAMNAGKFKALNQSAEQQVLNNLSDMDRLVKRTRLNRRKIVPLGYKEVEAEPEKENDAETDEIPEGGFQTRSLNMQEMPQIFDDEDFYRVLLNDLVDKKIQSSDPTSGLQFALRGAASTKLKKNVDSKASKGRKLRFHVQEPIANFDAPRSVLRWDDDQIDEFFASLLGQKINMKETEEGSADIEDDESDNEIVGDGSIQLFG